MVTCVEKNHLMIDRFFKLWVWFLPVTSITLVESIEILRPAIILSYLSIFVVLQWGGKKKYRFFRIIFWSIFFWGLITALAQIFALIFSQTSEAFFLINNTRQIITQALYLISGVSIVSFFACYYTKIYKKYIFYSYLLFCLYGMYVVIQYDFFDVPNADFLSNLYQYSIFQNIPIGDLWLARLTSLSGEPSMFALTLLPIFIWAMETPKIYFFKLVFGISLILSFSTTAYIGLLLYLIIKIIKDWHSFKTIFLVCIILIIVYFMLPDEIHDFLEVLVVGKISGEGISGADRTDSFESGLQLFGDLPFPNQLFGIGFLLYRSAGFFASLLVSVGIVGFIVWTLLFLVPSIRINKTNPTVVNMCFVIYVMMMASVPEFCINSIWISLGLAYHMFFINDSKEFENKNGF